MSGKFIKLKVPAGKANPSPPVGPALGQHGLNIMEFCKQFNAMTQAGYEPGTPLTAVIYFDPKQKKITKIELKKPPVSHYLKQAVKVSKGASQTGKEVIGEVSMAALRKIAEDKMVDMNANDVEGAMQMVMGSARSMGLKVEE